MGMRERHPLRGRVRLILRDVRSGEVVQESVVSNVVMTKGSELVARRFCGEPADPIVAVGVGTDEADPQDGNLDDLKAPVEDGDSVPERAGIQPISGATSYVFTDPATGSATVKFEATFEAAKANGALVEAGVFNNLAGGVLYNRVTFPVINKTDTHELTLIWEITISAETTGG